MCVHAIMQDDQGIHADFMNRVVCLYIVVRTLLYCTTMHSALIKGGDPQKLL